MTEEGFQHYVKVFNARDYDALHEHFSDDVQLLVNKISLKGRAGFDRFYGHFHQVVREEIQIVSFMSNENGFCADLLFRFTGLAPYKREWLEEKSGYAWRTELAVGEEFYMQNFIMYDVNEAGKIYRIRPALYEPIGGAEPLYRAMENA